MYKKCINFFTTDYLFTISLILAFISSLVGRFSSSFIDTKVILSLFGLMATVESLKILGLLDRFATQLTRLAKNKRQLFAYFIALSFIASMFVTNDVSILTLLPMFYLVCQQKISDKELVLGSVWIVVAANLGSSLFPSGNPQNIFLFSYYQLTLGQFFNWMLPFALLSVVILAFGVWFISTEPFEEQASPTKTYEKKQVIALLIFLVMVLYVVNILSQWWIVLLSLIILGVIFPKSYQKIDYRLLITFICFFIIVGNIKETPQIADLVQQSVTGSKYTLFTAALSSQVISNVPAAFLLAPFTDQAKSIVWGVNIGGLGTLIASLANLIGFRVLSTYVPHLKRSFFIWFSLLNLIYFLLFISLFYWLA